MPAEFWNTEGGWIQLRTNPVGHRSLLRVLNPISRELHAPTDSDRVEGRNFAPYLNPAGLRDFEERLRPLLAFANSGGDPQLRIFPTLDSFSRALDGVIRAAVRARGASADGAWQRRMSEPARLALNEVRARLDKSNRAFYATVTGKRAMFERQLLPAATTLVVVPEPLLEHWFEMFRRHVDLRCLQPRSDGGGGRSAVWIDGVGDMSTVAQFRLRPAPYDTPLPDEYDLATFAVVVTTFERCAREHAREGLHDNDGGNSPLMRARWLRLVVDEGHELGAENQTPAEAAANKMIAALPAERRWIMSGTPTVGKAVVGAGGALVQLERLLRFLREPRYGVAAAGGAKRWARDVSGPVARAADGATTKLIDLLQPLVVRHTKADLSLPEPTWLPVWSAVRTRMEEEGEVAFTSRVCRGAAEHILQVMGEARGEWRRQERRGRAPKAVVFSEFQNDLEQVCLRLPSPATLST